MADPRQYPQRHGPGHGRPQHQQRQEWVAQNGPPARRQQKAPPHNNQSREQGQAPGPVRPRNEPPFRPEQQPQRPQPVNYEEFQNRAFQPDHIRNHQKQRALTANPFPAQGPAIPAVKGQPQLPRINTNIQAPPLNAPRAPAQHRQVGPAQRHNHAAAPAKHGRPFLPNNHRPQIAPSGNPQAPDQQNKTLKVGFETYTVVATLQSAKDKDSIMSRGVYLLADSQQRKCVAKYLPLSDEGKRARSRAEIEALRKVKSAVRVHENINLIRDYALPATGPQATVIIEYCSNGSLSNAIDEMRLKDQHVSESLAFHFFYGVAKALAMLHHGYPDHNDPTSKIHNWTTICHLDIKPPNILLSAQQAPGRGYMPHPRVVLADFGCCVTADDIQRGREDRIVQENGTPGWFPPEQQDVPRGETVGRYGKPTDIWQTAAAIQAVCLRLMHPDINRIQQPVGPRYGPELNCLVAACLNPEYMKRPTAMDLCKELRKVMVKKGYPV